MLPAETSREIIDLTGSPQRLVIESSEDELQLLQDNENGKKVSKPRKRKVNRKTNVAGAVNEDDQAVQMITKSRTEKQDRGDDEVDSLFFIDTKPTTVPSNTGAESHSKADPSEDHGVLLLPPHVSLDSAEINRNKIINTISLSNVDSDEDDYIEYLDTEDRTVPGTVRYFADPPEDTKPVKFLCKHCGEEGTHRTRDCPVLICLTCGARGEHSTRSCPISKVCYTCGMKGHINSNCPNRHTSSREIDMHDECERCGSSRHRTNECPTLWRLYEYVSDSERQQILYEREGKRTLLVGNGGEGYIGTSVWCYNCGRSGHCGDECSDPHLSDFPNEPSAFSRYNLMSGPFYESTYETSVPNASTGASQDRTRELWNENLPTHVGEKARKRDKARLQQLHEEQEEDDWFGNPRGYGDRTSFNSRKNNTDKRPERGNRNSSSIRTQSQDWRPLKVQFAPRNRGQEPTHYIPERRSEARPSLLDRIDIGDTVNDPPYSLEPRNRSGGYTRNHRNRYKVGGEFERGRDRVGERYRNGPRYKGGYS